MKRYSTPIALAATIFLAAPNAFAADDPFTQMRKLGVSIPGWLIDPTVPVQAGDGRPSTPISETASYMVMLKVAETGTPLECKVLMSNGPEDFGSGLCTRSMLMRFNPAAKKFRRAFWIHAYTDPKTTATTVTIGPDVQIRQP